MPHSAPFAEQSHRWFAVLIFAVLPFIIVYKVMKGQLPHLREISPKK